MVKHTIILIQFTPDKKTRRYDDFPSVAAAMDGICKFYEHKLRTTFPEKKHISYDIGELFTYIDQLPDLGALVLDPRTQSYLPKNKEWVKQRVFKHLKKMAELSGSSNINHVW